MRQRSRGAWSAWLWVLLGASLMSGCGGPPPEKPSTETPTPETPTPETPLLKQVTRRVLDTNHGHTLLARADGTVWAWGSNHQGQLGDGTQATRYSPVPVSGLTNVVAVAAGGNHSLALRQDGTVWTWGSNLQGQLGDGTKTSPRLTPAQVSGLTGVVAIAAGGSHSLAIRQDGTVWGWGANDSSQLGSQTSAEQPKPLQVPGLTGVGTVAAGAGYTLALRQDGTVWALGDNSYGQLGNGTLTGPRATPAQVPGLLGVVALEAGYRSAVAVRQDGTVWTWGDNSRGQLGSGTLTGPRTTPGQVPGLLDVVDVGVSDQGHVLARLGNGSVWGWGFNDQGQLGDGTDTPRATPVLIPGLTRVAGLAAGGTHSLAMHEDGSVWGWGESRSGSLGVGGPARRPTPVEVSGLSGVVAVEVGTDHSLALDTEGHVWTWGRGIRPEGQTLPASASPVRLPELSGVVAIAAGPNDNLVVRGDGTVWGWGSFFSNPHPGMPVPVQVPGLSGIVAVETVFHHSVALRSDGTVWQWFHKESDAYSGASVHAAPFQVQALTDVVAIAAGDYHSLALRKDGTLWAWGYNPVGQLGDGTVHENFVSVPVRVQGLTGVKAIAAGGNHSVAVLQDGTVWNWGAYILDVPEDGPHISRTPVQVPGLTDVVSVSARYHTALALRGDGTVWRWGENEDGTYNPGFAPEQVQGLTNVKALADWSLHSMVVLTDGTVRAWGENYYGQLGDGTSGLRFTPARTLLP